MCIAYETVTSPQGGLPLLAPMSEVAGRMAVQAGAYYLEKPHGGLGVLLGGVPGVRPGEGRAASAAAWSAAHAVRHRAGHGRGRLGARPQSSTCCGGCGRSSGGPLNTVFSTRDAIERHVLAAPTS